MNKQTFGNMIATLRKEHGMTQLELAEIFNVSVDELMQVKAEAKEVPVKDKISELVNLGLKGVALAMGIAVVQFSEETK